MSIVGWIVAIVFVAGMLVAGCIALGNDEDAFGGVRVVQLADHEYDDGCWEGECYDGGRGGYWEDNGGYGDGRGGDGRFGGGRSGDYDGGPGDDCRNACGNTIIVPTPGDRGGGDRGSR